jgi:short-subunit dehydrogenase
MKTIFITGATSGIGKATAETFAKQGYKLIICGRRKEVLEQLQIELSNLTQITQLKFFEISLWGNPKFRRTIFCVFW